MCGIFGVVVRKDARIAPALVRKSLTTLARLSESRGKDSSGFAFRSETDRAITVIRASMPISSLMKHQAFTNELERQLGQMSNGNGVSTQSAFAAMGHSRLVTNGTQLDDRNNQPVVKDGIVGVHNGIIVNVNELWQTMPIGPREYGIDTEVMFSLFRHFDDRPNFSSTAISKTCAKIFGTVATGFFADDKDELVLVTNNGSLYVLTDSKDILIFASERHILESLVQNHNLYSSVSGLKVVHVNARSGYVVRLSDLATSRFTFDDGQIEDFESAVSERYSINMQPVSGPDCNKSLLVDFETIVADPNAKHEKALLEYNVDEVSKLQRCTECVLPETFPFIFFDSNGACNYCNNYRLKNQPRPLDDLLELVAPYRSTDGSCDCIVPYSGGRDSTFTLHMVKKVLKLNPIAFTYDWGMVTDLARRNIARVCGRLGVENIIVAADIVKKRDNIRKNILAWLKRPSLGMIPLFMSGDKYFFYYTNQLKKQTGIRLNLWGINPLENTDFKTGFAGLGPRFDKKRIYSLSLAGQIGLFAYVGKNFLQNPSYLNSSNLDTLGSMFSRYMFPKKDYYSIFDYYQWNEKEIEKLILGEYEWEKAIDTKSTWRIGDGTASFYNYVYYNVAGFSEIDTFRSNQIREGLLTREEAMGHIVDENVPRYENLKWYLEIVGVDFVNAVNTINSIPKLYNSGKFERSLRSVAGGRP